MWRAIRASLFRVLILAFAIIFSPSAYPEEITSSRISIFKDAVEAVGAAGDAIAKLTDGFKQLVIAGVGGYKYLSAERDYERLKDISARGINLQQQQQQVIVQSIDEYLGKENPTPGDWYAVRSQMQTVIGDVRSLLDDVRTERSDFVLEEAYSKLGASLASRSLMLDKIARLPQPVSKQEIEEITELNKEYKRLLTNFRAAIQELNLYLKQQQNG